MVSVLCSPVWQVWGSKAEGAVHSPPDNIIWKAVENWGCGAPGEKTVTKLVAPSGDVSPSIRRTSEKCFTLPPSLPPSLPQVVATFSQRSEVKITPVKSKQQVSGSPSSLADAGSLSYPSLPESGEDPLPSSSSSSTTQRPPGSVQRVGDEHMFHQKVIPHGRFSPLLPSYLCVLVLCVACLARRLHSLSPSPTDTV